MIMFSEDAWRELVAREYQFQRFFNGEKPDYLLSWFFDGSLNQINPGLLIEKKDKDAWLNHQFQTVKSNVEQALDSASLFYPIIEMFSLYGTHYMDVLFGAKVEWNGSQFWNQPLGYPVSELKDPDLEKHPLVRQTVELAKWIKEKTGGRFLISMPDVGCPLNIAINLFGEEFLTEMVSDPSSAKRALNLIARATCQIYEFLIEAVGWKTLRCHNAYYVYTPCDYAGLSICATQLISSEHFRNLVADADDAAAPMIYKGLFQHICGYSTQHIPEIARRKRIKGLQLNDAGADDFEAYFKGLRPDQIFYVWPTSKMTLEKILSLSGGQRTVLMGKLEKRILV